MAAFTDRPPFFTSATDLPYWSGPGSVDTELSGLDFPRISRHLRA